MDNYIFFIENKTESKDQVLSALQNNLQAYTYLLESGYLSQASYGFCFSFVGVISVNTYIICVLPKYYLDDTDPSRNILSDFIQIVKVLKKAGATEPSIPDYYNLTINENINLSEIVLADKLIKDYIEYGLFVKSKDLTSVNASGEINWNKTIESVDPLFSKNRPLYVDFYNSSSVTEVDNIITEIHKWLLKYSFSKYGELLDYHIELQEDTVNKLSELGPTDFLIELLKRELSLKYVDRDIMLIKRMITLLKKQQGTTSDRFSLFGTSYFHTIWEKACGVYFDNKVEAFKHLIPAPFWHDLNGNKIQKESFRLDIVAVSETESNFFILDAKYYNLIQLYKPEFSVQGNPGIGDVTKEFLYERIFESLPYKFKYNCFLFPSLMDSEFQIVGSVSFLLFPYMKIFNLYMSTKAVFKSYLSNKPKDEIFLNTLSAEIAKI